MQTFKAIECGTVTRAVERSESTGGTAIHYQGKAMVAGRALLAALERSRAGFAYLVRHEPTGRIMTIPVN